MGLQYCLDFQDSSHWPVRANDIIANINQTSDAFQLVTGSPEAPPSTLRPGSSLFPLPAVELAKQLSLALECSHVKLVAVGTHPTLTLEAVTMIRDFAFTSTDAVKVVRTYGITYKCTVFPEMCGEGMESSDDPIAALIGRFEAPPPYELYTFEVIAQRLAEVAFHLDFDLLVCTSPFVVCGLLQQLTGKPMLGYLGLPLLWKRPTDHFDNSTARTHFWGLLTYLVHRSDVVLASNNPILAEQIAFQSKGGRASSSSSSCEVYSGCLCTYSLERRYAGFSNQIFVGDIWLCPSSLHGSNISHQVHCGKFRFQDVIQRDGFS